MARVAEQYGKNEMALLLLEELDTAALGNNADTVGARAAV